MMKVLINLSAYVNGARPWYTRECTASGHTIARIKRFRSDVQLRLKQQMVCARNKPAAKV